VCVSVTKEFLRQQIEERERQKHEEKERRLHEDLELEKLYQQQQQRVQMSSTQQPQRPLQQPQPPPQLKTPQNTWTVAPVDQTSVQPAPPVLSRNVVSTRQSRAVDFSIRICVFNGCQNIIFCEHKSLTVNISCNAAVYF